MSARAASDRTASSASSVSNDVSRVAVWARISAIPSRRLSIADRRASLLISARTRARSWRARTATTWNFVRSEDSTRPRWAAASTSDAVRASTGMMPSLRAAGTTLRRTGGAVSAPETLVTSSHELLLSHAIGARPPSAIGSHTW